METLCGVVAVVEVECEERTTQLCTTLKDLGATVLPLWSPLVTHVIWAKGGCRATRSVARAQASFVVSPMWVDACASAKRRLPEQAFPTTPRESDLPSPKRLLKIVDKALREKVPVIDFLPISDEKRSVSNLRLPGASETDTVVGSRSIEPTIPKAVASTSVDTSADTSVDIESRVNTAPRRALPISMSPPPVPSKSRRMLFTQKEVQGDDSATESEEDVNMPGPSTSKRPTVKIPKPGEPSTSGVGLPNKRARVNLTQRERKGLDRAERMANKLAEEKKPPARTTGRRMIRTRDGRPRIVLSALTLEERHKIHQICLSLNAKIQSRVSKHTTHVILGNCLVRAKDTTMPEITYTPATGTNGSNVTQMRTANALMGAARGCRIVSPQWAYDSEPAGMWLNHGIYEVSHLKKLSDKAYEERRAFSLMKDEFGYDIFIGKKIRLSPTAQNRKSCEQLLSLCGAVVLSHDNRIIHNRELYEYGQYSGNENFSEEPDGPITPDYSIGTELGQVSSCWVFDSVAAGRMKTVHRYVHIP